MRSRTLRTKHAHSPLPHRTPTGDAFPPPSLLRLAPVQAAPAVNQLGPCALSRARPVDAFCTRFSYATPRQHVLCHCTSKIPIQHGLHRPQHQPVAPQGRDIQLDRYTRYTGVDLRQRSLQCMPGAAGPSQRSSARVRVRQAASQRPCGCSCRPPEDLGHNQGWGPLLGASPVGNSVVRPPGPVWPVWAAALRSATAASRLAAAFLHGQLPWPAALRAANGVLT